MIQDNYLTLINCGGFGFPNSGKINNIDNDECYVFAVGEASEKTANRLSVNNKNLYRNQVRTFLRFLNYLRLKYKTS